MAAGRIFAQVREVEAERQQHAAFQPRRLGDDGIGLRQQAFIAHRRNVMVPVPKLRFQMARQVFVQLQFHAVIFQVPS